MPAAGPIYSERSQIKFIFLEQNSNELFFGYMFPHMLETPTTNC